MIVEDCAHTLRCKLGSKNLGNFGDIACYSLQTNKLINCGEGGFLCTDCPYTISKAIVYSGSYANYGRHLSGPDFLLKDPSVIRNETSRNTKSDRNRILHRIASESSSEDKMMDADFIY